MSQKREIHILEKTTWGVSYLAKMKLVRHWFITVEALIHQAMNIRQLLRSENHVGQLVERHVGDFKKTTYNLQCKSFCDYKDSR